MGDCLLNSRSLKPDSDVRSQIEKFSCACFAILLIFQGVPQNLIKAVPDLSSFSQHCTVKFSMHIIRAKYKTTERDELRRTGAKKSADAQSDDS